MPGDVAMQDPRTGVVWLESNCKVSILWKHSNVAARRVLEVEFGRRRFGVPFFAALSDDGEIMTLWVSTGCV